MRHTPSLDTLSLSLSLSPSYLGLTNPPSFGFAVRRSVQQLSFALTQASSSGSLLKRNITLPQKTLPVVLRIRVPVLISLFVH